MTADSTVALWRPVGAYELRLIARSGYRAFPPRLPEQPVFYPVCNEAYAAEIATRWNLDDPNSGYAGFVTRFDVPAGTAAAFERRTVGAAQHQELWIPSEELSAFCEMFVGPIRVERGWLGARFGEVAPWDGPTGELVGEVLTRAVELVSSERLRGAPLTEMSAGVRFLSLVLDAVPGLVGEHRGGQQMWVMPAERDPTLELVVWLDDGEPSVSYGGWHTHASVCAGDPALPTEERVLAVILKILADELVLVCEEPDGVRELLPLADDDALLDLLTDPYGTGDVRVRSWSGVHDRAVGPVR